MGATLARRLLSEGLAVTVWNRNPAAAGPLVNDGAQAVTELPEVWKSAGDGVDFPGQRRGRPPGLPIRQRSCR